MLTRQNTIVIAAVAALVFIIAWAGGAFAADLRPSYSVSKTATAVRAPTWTGFYTGIQGGYAWGEVDATGLPVALGTSTNGWLGGVRIGFDYQIPNTRVVAGMLAEASLGGVRGTATLGGVNVPAEADLIGSLRARLGYAFDGFMVYGTGGLSAARYDISIAGTPFSGEATQWSWIAGAGVEAKLFENWSIGAEYLYRGRASENVCFTVALCAPFEAESQSVLAYLNYRW